MYPSSRTPGIHAVVLAGSHGWGQSAFERLLPRPLLPVAHEPLVCHAVGWLGRSGVDRASICTNMDVTSLQEALGDGSHHGLSLDYATDPTPRGPGGCVRDATRAVDCDTVVILDGTTIPSIDLQAVIETHEVCQAALTVVVHQEGFAQSRRWGALTPAGIYIVDRRVLESIPAKGFYDIKEGLIPDLHARNERVVTHMALGANPQILNAGTYLAVNNWMVERIGREADAPRDYCASGQALVHASARVAAGARLVGPVIVGAQANVASGSTIVGPAVVGERTNVAPGAVISRSTTWKDCYVGEGAVVDQCILADETLVAPEAAVFRSVMTDGGARGMQPRPLRVPTTSALPSLSPRAVARGRNGI
jgi:NDP-sugar pyrophosphorylase family protein